MLEVELKELGAGGRDDNGEARRREILARMETVIVEQLGAEYAPQVRGSDRYISVLRSVGLHRIPDAHVRRLAASLRLCELSYVKTPVSGWGLEWQNEVSGKQLLTNTGLPTLGDSRLGPEGQER